MGVKRFIKHMIVPTTIYTDIAKNIKEEKSAVKGIKKSIKQEIAEDNPITKAIYEIGSFDGKEMGYNDASKEYEEKLLKQAEAFLRQKELFENKREEYEALLNEYDKQIDILTEKNNRTESENKRLHKLIQNRDSLQKLA